MILLVAVLLACGPSHETRSPDAATAATPTPSTEHVHDPHRLFGLLAELLDNQAQGWETELGIDVQIVAAGPQEGALLLQTERWIEKLGVGADVRTGGLLVLVEADGSRARIAVTYGLEGVFPDGLLGDLADNQLAPYASYGKPAMAVIDVLSALRIELLGRVANDELPLHQEYRELATVQSTLAFLSGGGGADTRIPPRPSDGWKAPVPDETRDLYAPSRDPLESFEAYLRAQAHLVGDPELDLFTAGTRFQRHHSPLAPYENLKRARDFENSRPFYVLKEGDRAVVRSEHPVGKTYPVLLQRIDGRWRVDLVEVFKNLFFAEDGMAFVANPDNPYQFGLEGLPAYSWRERPPGDGWGIAAVELSRDLQQEVDALQAALDERPDAHIHMNLAELLLRNSFSWEMALRHYDAAVLLAPDDTEILSVAADRALHMGLHDVAMVWLESLGPAGYERRAYVHRRAGRLQEALHWYRLAIEQDPFAMRARQALKEIQEKINAA